MTWEWYTPRNGKWIATNQDAVEHMMEFRGGIGRPDLREPEGAEVDKTSGLRIRLRQPEKKEEPPKEQQDQQTSITDLFKGA